MPEMRKTREGFGRALVELGHANPDVVVLVGDLTDSTMVVYSMSQPATSMISEGSRVGLITWAAGWRAGSLSSPSMLNTGPRLSISVVSKATVICAPHCPQAAARRTTCRAAS